MALYEQLARRFGGKSFDEFYGWMATELKALGGRSPAQALLDGNAHAVVRLLILRLPDKAKTEKNRPKFFHSLDFYGTFWLRRKTE